MHHNADIAGVPRSFQVVLHQSEQTLFICAGSMSVHYLGGGPPHLDGDVMGS